MDFISKVCSKCGKTKPIIEFYKRKNTTDGYRKDCKECFALRDSNRYLRNSEKIKRNNSQYYLKNRTIAISRVKKHYNENKENIKKYRNSYYSKNRNEILEGRREKHHLYYQNNKKTIIKKHIAYKKIRYKNDIDYKILCCLRSRVRDALKNNSKSKSTKELMGCSITEFKQHIERQWLPGMSWDNYGYGNDKWNIDHIIPCASFDMSNPEKQKICFHYSNLQPLWQPDNFKKQDKIYLF